MPKRIARRVHLFCFVLCCFHRRSQWHLHQESGHQSSPSQHALLPPGAGTDLTLLLIDAEGHDAAIVLAFPFARVSVSRLTFEAAHVPNARFMATGDYLRAHGFELVFGGFKSHLSTWHHVNASR